MTDVIISQFVPILQAFIASSAPGLAKGIMPSSASSFCATAGGFILAHMKLTLSYNLLEQYFLTGGAGECHYYLLFI